MSTDRELLELAAKAYWRAEIDDVCSVGWAEADQCIAYTHGDNQDHNGQDVTLLWNPLTDDGDALRLAVRLGLCVEVDNCEDATRVSETEYELLAKHMHFDDGPEAATRRAIVRAAAEIGKQIGNPVSGEGASDE